MPFSTAGAMDLLSVILIPLKESSLCQSLLSFSADLVSTYYDGSGQHRSKTAVCVGAEGLGRNDEGLGLVWGKPWNLTGEPCRKGFQVLGQEGGAPQRSQAGEAPGLFSDQTPLL